MPHFRLRAVISLAASLLISPVTLFAQGGTDISTTTSVSVSPANPTPTQQVTLSVSVSPGAACQASTPGSILIYGSGSGPSSSDQVQYQEPVACFSRTIGPLPAGTYYVYATYLGSTGVNEGVPGYLGSTSPLLNYTVTQPGGTAGAALNGQYAFLLQGTFNPTGPAYTTAAVMGSFTADGEGKITSGLVDVASIGGATPRLPVTGTYTLDTTGVGSVTLNGAGPALTFTITTPATQAAATVQTASAISQGAVFGSGQLLKQTPADFGTTGQFVLNLSGIVPSTGYGPGLYSSSGSLTTTAGQKVSGVLNASIGGVVNNALDNFYLFNAAPYSGTSGPVDPTTGFFSVLAYTQTQPAVYSLPNHYDAVQIDGSRLFLIDTDNGTPQNPFQGEVSGTAVQ